MEDWCTLMTLPLSEVLRPMGFKFTNCFFWAWAVEISSEEVQKNEKKKKQGDQSSAKLKKAQ